MHGALKYRYLCNKFYTSILKTSRDNHVIKNKSRNCHEKRLNQAVVYNTVIIVQILNMKITSFTGSTFMFGKLPLFKTQIRWSSFHPGSMRVPSFTSIRIRQSDKFHFCEQVVRLKKLKTFKKIKIWKIKILNE